MATVRRTPGSGSRKPLSLVEQSAPNSVAEQQDSDEAPRKKTRAERNAIGGANLKKAADAARQKRVEAKERRLASADPRTRLQRYRDGDYPISEWDDDEISKGKPRSSDGSFSGAYPRFTGKERAEIRRELIARGQRMLEEHYTTALSVIANIAMHGDNDGVRLKAANILMERTAGKTVERVEVHSADPWQDILDEVMDDEVLRRVADGA